MTTDTIKLRLPREAVLCRRGEFLFVQRQGKRRAGKFLVIYAVNAPRPLPIPRFGITISRRVSKRAVIRNRMRRRLREIIRHELPDLRVDTWFVIIARKWAVEASWTELRQEALSLFRRSGLYRQTKSEGGASLHSVD